MLEPERALGPVLRTEQDVRDGETVLLIWLAPIDAGPELILEVEEGSGWRPLTVEQHTLSRWHLQLTIPGWERTEKLTRFRLIWGPHEKGERLVEEGVLRGELRRR